MFLLRNRQDRAYTLLNKKYKHQKHQPHLLVLDFDPLLSVLDVRKTEHKHSSP